jgi:hypothetical protein
MARCSCASRFLRGAIVGDSHKYSTEKFNHAFCMLGNQSILIPRKTNQGRLDVPYKSLRTCYLHHATIKQGRKQYGRMNGESRKRCVRPFLAVSVYAYVPAPPYAYTFFFSRPCGYSCLYMSILRIYLSI